jgi:hypothetical protein
LAKGEKIVLFIFGSKPAFTKKSEEMDDESMPLAFFSSVEDQFEKDYKAVTSEDVLGGKGWLLHNVLTPEECKVEIPSQALTELQIYLQACNNQPWQEAADYCYQYRDRLNDRLMFDDERLAGEEVLSVLRVSQNSSSSVASLTFLAH